METKRPLDFKSLTCLSDGWTLINQQLIHKLFKVLFPRYLRALSVILIKLFSYVAGLGLILFLYKLIFS